MKACCSRPALWLALGCVVFPVRSTRATPTTVRVSIATDGTQGNGSTPFENGRYDPLSISADGRYVAFDSTSTNLVPGDTNESLDIFVRDTVTGTTKRVSVASDGTQADSGSSDPSISADGRYVAFQSAATNLVPINTQRHDAIFVRDMVAGTTKLVSVAFDGTPANSDSWYASISADGRYVAFQSIASNLVPINTHSWGNIFVRDTVAGTTKLVSMTFDGTEPNNSCDRPSISADGRYVAFESGSHNLIPNETTFGPNIFVRDMVAGTTKLVSVASDGTQGTFCETPSISADGRYVAFASSSNLVPGDTNFNRDVFVRDTMTGTTTRASVAYDGAQVYEGGCYPSISADGRYVAFGSFGSSVVPGDTNRAPDDFVRGPLFDAVPVPYTRTDVAAALKTAGGLAAPSDITRWNVEDPTGHILNIRDAVRLARKAVGLDPNP